MPVQRSFKGTRTVAEMEIDESRKWRTKLLKSLELHYSKAPAYSDMFPVASSLLQFETTSVFEFNLNALRTLMGLLGIDPGKLVLSSSLSVTEKSTKRIVALTQAVGGTAYLSGRVAMETYQDPDLFHQAGVELIAQNFLHPKYQQGGDFVAGLSILDPLFWCGPEYTAKLCGGTNR